MKKILDDQSLDRLFRATHAPQGWLDTPLSDALLEAAWELAKGAPVSASGSLAHVVFLRSNGAKARLARLLAPGAIPRAAAPVLAILGQSGEGASDGLLAGAYLLMAGRALGLDCELIGGFDRAKVDAAFFPDGGVTSSLICALGYGDPAGPGRPVPRLAASSTCRII